MKILIVGAGAVGLVYGRHLSLGGAQVSFFVRPQYAEECRRGFKLYPLNRSNPRANPIDFEAQQILTTLEEVRSQRWDQVYLTMSTTALYGDWLAPFVEAIGTALLVTLQPGVENRAHLLTLVPAERLVCGLISLISYHAPLPGEAVPVEGTAYWFPPASPGILSGPRAGEVVTALKAGNMPAKAHADVPRLVALPNAILMVLITALEGVGWSFARLKSSDALLLGSRAVGEAAQVVATRQGTRAAWVAQFVRPWSLRLILNLAPAFVPLDLETYLRVHFTKVGDQTRYFMAGYIQAARELGLPWAAMAELEIRVTPKMVLASDRSTRASTSTQ